MILYNITINIEREHHAEWQQWIQNRFFPLMKETGLFLENKMLKLLNETEDNPGITYSFQFFTKDLRDLERFQDEFEYAILSELYQKFKDRFVEFRTILEVME